MRGLTGPIEFKEGRRIQFKLDLLKLKQHALVKVGEWSPGTGVNITDRSAFFDPGTMNVTLVVITIPVSQLHSHTQLLLCSQLFIPWFREGSVSVSHCALCKLYFQLTHTYIIGKCNTLKFYNASPNDTSIN
jgi:hypothetical protein